MKHLFIFLFLLIALVPARAQKLAKIIYVGDKGVTQNSWEATQLVVIKIYPDRSFERKDYKYQGTLMQQRTYKDSSLKVLHGPYASYWSNGFVKERGTYSNNKKNGYWEQYDDAGKMLIGQTYVNDSIVATSTDDVPGSNKEAGFKEAQFIGGMKELSSFLRSTINAEIAFKVKNNSGQVIGAYTINTSGLVEDLYVFKSADFKLDEEMLRVVPMMPAWKPAKRNGKKVKAYRKQPLSFDAREL